MITVELAPFSKPRPRVTRGGQHTYMDDKYVKAKGDLRLLYQNAGGEVDIEGAISLTVIFVFVMPKSWSEKRKKEMDGTWCLKRPDLDNAIGGVMDALLAEDSKVARFGECVKVWGRENAIHIEIDAEDLYQYTPF